MMRFPTSSARATATSERGTALVEFAFVLPLLLTLVLGIMDFGRALNYWIEETHLSNEGARWAAVDTWPGCPPSTVGLCTGANQLQRYISDQVTTNELAKAGSGFQVCVTKGTTFGDPVKVTVSYSFQWLKFFTFFGAGATTTLQNSATVRQEGTPQHFATGCYTR